MAVLCGNTSTTTIRINAPPPQLRWQAQRGGASAGPSARKSPPFRLPAVRAASDRQITSAAVSSAKVAAAAAAAAKVTAAAKATLVREPPKTQREAGVAVEEEEHAWQGVGTSSASVFLADTAMWQSGLPELDLTDGFTGDESTTAAAAPTVGDYMTRRPVCVHPRASLKSAARLLAACAVSGVPVVEPYEGDAVGAGRLVGVLSQRDVLWKETVPYPGEDDLMGDPYEGPMSPSLKAQLGKIRSRTVAHAMTAAPLYVEEDALVSDAATIMINRHVARLPVVAPREGGKPGTTVVGILTAADILRHTLLSL
ncbi:hypothetical protein CLOM_g14449 [Closterium sp. NIES-68]|nr:hypothetical protein CLOM_g14449 [Closterium sp. NIES-68]GJP82271.1 hypothetical protein CLOP_g12506 [Closterium sp. NIES-67]